MDQSYRDAIATEIDLLIASLQIQQEQGQEQEHHDGNCENKKIRLSSIYFGGGTPSLAPIETIQYIIHHILAPNGIFTLEDNAEITIEMDPGTFTKNHMQSLQQIGFNRISLGVQSFNNTILEGIGRVHRHDDIEQAIGIIRHVFGSDANYSLDLISGLPGLTLDLWSETLRMALALDPAPNHLSVYDLQIEQGTTFGKWYPNNHDDDDDDDDENGNGNGNEQDEDEHSQEFKSVTDMTAAVASVLVPSASNVHLPLPSAGDCATMYKYASEYLRCNGFEHYEISSYARLKQPLADGDETIRGHPSGSSSIQQTENESFRSQHNQIYWRIDSEWYAVGLSATSSINGKRFARKRMLADYIDWVKNQQQSSASQEWKPDWLSPKNNNANNDDHNDENNEDDEETILDTILTRLRTKEGLDLNWIAAQDKGDNLLQCILKGAELGLELGLAERVQGKDDDDDTLRLIDPEGFLFSNTVISSIFAELP